MPSTNPVFTQYIGHILIGSGVAPGGDVIHQGALIEVLEWWCCLILKKKIVCRGKGSRNDPTVLKNKLFCIYC